MTQIKFVGLDELYNLVIHDFFIWNYLVPQNFVWICNIQKFKSQPVETNSNEQMTQIKFVGLDELYNLVIHHFFVWNYLVPQNWYNQFFS